MPFQKNNNLNPLGRPKRYWITEKQRVVQARKSFKTMCEIRDGRIKEQEWDDEKKELITVAASVKDVLTASIKIMAYAVGEPTKSVELTGADGGPIETADRLALIKLSKDPVAVQLARQLAELTLSHNGNGNGADPS